jgi:hypothetical protein
MVILSSACWQVGFCICIGFTELSFASVVDFTLSITLQIYPNPTSTSITVELPTTPRKNTSLTIYNLNGQQLITHLITEPRTVIDVSGLPKGFYFVKVVDAGKVMIGKVVKE